MKKLKSFSLLISAMIVMSGLSAVDKGESVKYNRVHAEIAPTK